MDATQKFSDRKWLIYKEGEFWKIHLLSDEDRKRFRAHEQFYPSSEGAVASLADNCLADIGKCIEAIREKQRTHHLYGIVPDDFEEEAGRLLHDFELFQCLMNGECVRRVKPGRLLGETGDGPMRVPDFDLQRKMWLLHDGIRIGFIGKEWNLIAGAEVMRLLREEFEGCGVEGSFDRFLAWAVDSAGGDIGNRLPASLNLYDDDGESFDKLRSAVIELLNRYTHRNDDHTMLPANQPADQ